MTMLHSKDLPLSEKLRPKEINDLLGQAHLLGQDAPISRMLEGQYVRSMIFWGPPGSGKTSLAELISQKTQREFMALSAINSGVKDIREAIEKAKILVENHAQSPILFIDEIHRFSKSQQDSLLQAVEKSWIILIGATTQNPSFEVVSALLSRCQVYSLNALSREELTQLSHTSIQRFNTDFSCNLSIQNPEALVQFSGGDARKLINTIEQVLQHFSKEKNKNISPEDLAIILQQNTALYDKNSENHYDVISAFIKSIRGSDPNASLVWLAKMLVAGEEVKFIARRLLILASEDIGLANPNALSLANACFQAVHTVGMPESRILLSQCTVYLAVSPKSNSTYVAINQAMEWVKQHPDLSVPLDLRNAPTSLMKKSGYGAQYQYSHNSEHHFIEQNFMPLGFEDLLFYQPANNATENKIMDELKKKWPQKYT